MPPLFEEWWKWHIVLDLSTRPSVSVRVRDGLSNLHLSFSDRRILSYGFISNLERDANSACHLFILWVRY